MLIVRLVLLIFTSVTAQADKVDDYITSEMKNRRIPGLAFATGTLLGLDKVEWEHVDVPRETRMETMRRATGLPGSRAN